MPPKAISVKTAGQVSPRESPRNTVRIAPVDKIKESKETEVHVPSIFGQASSKTTEFVSFKEEIRDMLKSMNKTISRNVTDTITEKIETLDQIFSNMFTEIKEDIKGIRTEVLEAKAEVDKVKTKMDEMEVTLEFQEKILTENDENQKANLNKVKAEIDTKLRELNEKILLMEKQDRKYNLLFYGFPEEGSENLFDKLRKVFVKDLEIDSVTVENMYFVHGHRMPVEIQEGSRPIILRFAHYGDRELVLSRAFKLGGTKKRILSDLPVVMKKERRRLAKEAYTIRKGEGLQTRIKDKGLDVYLEVRKESVDKWVKRAV